MPYLAVPAFGERQLDPGRGYRLPEPDRGKAGGQLGFGVQHFRHCRTGPVALDLDALLEGGQSFAFGHSFDLHPIGSGVRELRIGENVLSSAVVGQQDKPFGIAVQPTRRVNAGNRNEILQRLLAGDG